MSLLTQNLNLPSPDQQRAIAESSGDMPDGRYEDMEIQRTYDDALPGIVRIVELDDEIDDFLEDNPYVDPDFSPESYSAARSRGNVVRKRKVKETKEKKSRSRSGGRKTRSQTVQNKEVEVE